jgi:serine phosphatase RsbU (regulator of sigma subunit)
VETHAAILDAILTENWITKPVDTDLIQYAVIFFAGLVSVFLFGFARPRVYIPLAAALVVAVTASSAFCFYEGVYVSPVYALLTVVLTSVCMIFARLWQEERRRILVASELAVEMERKERAQADLDVARTIQSSALPKLFPPFGAFGELEIFAEMRPAKDVGGDFYDCFAIDENRFAALVADVSGKGVPAALFMMKAQSVIRSGALSGAPPDAALAAANEELCRDNDTGMFVTAFLAIYDKERGEISFANAGHNPPLVASGRDVRWLGVEKNFVLGAFGGIDYSLQKIPFAGGDALILYSDGVTEMMNGSREMFGEDRLLSLAGNIFAAERSARETADAVSGAAGEFAGGADQSDDVTILVMKKIR